jgi:outer membrane protein assembly factor BamB
MRLKPLLVGDLIIAFGSDGRVMVIDAPSAAGLWDKRLLNGVEAQPVTGNGLVYIAGLDQYLWAIDIHTGRTNWKYLTESPLRSPPTLIGDALYQYIPAEGLLCFAARPVDMPGGEIRWTADVEGLVLGRDGHRLLVWDESNRVLTLLDADRGSVIKTVSLPSVKHLYVTSLVDGDLIAAGDDGRVIALVPKNRSKDS